MRNGRVWAVALVAAMAAGCAEDEESTAPGWAPATVAVTAMPASGFSVEWGMPGVPSPVKPGASFAVGVAVKNTGDQIWLDPRTADPESAAGAVRLTSRWWGADAKKPYSDYAARGELPSPVHPGQTAVMAVPVVAPAEPGNYQLQLELVQENFGWFEQMGAQVLRVPVTVAAEASPRNARGATSR